MRTTCPRIELWGIPQRTQYTDPKILSNVKRCILFDSKSISQQRKRRLTLTNWAIDKHTWKTQSKSLERFKHHILTWNIEIRCQTLMNFYQGILSRSTIWKHIPLRWSERDKNFEDLNFNRWRSKRKEDGGCKGNKMKLFYYWVPALTCRYRIYVYLFSTGRETSIDCLREDEEDQRQ